MAKYRIFNPISFAIILMALALSSCKDWLTLAPENDLVKDKFWTKKQDVDAALAATYNAFRAGALKTFVMGEVRADIATFGDLKDYTDIAGSNISISNEKVKWNNYYETINLANTLMFYSPDVLAKDVTFTPEMKDAVDAEALFLRSLSYFYLVRLYKEVPLVLQPSVSDTSKLFIPKSSEKEVLQQIIKDLLAAKDLAYTTKYKNDKVNPWYFNGRANKYSIMALLADVYLWDEQYQNCINYCDSVTQSGLYSLESTENWFLNYNPGNSPVESIFEIQYNASLPDQQNPLYDDLIFNRKLGFSKNLSLFIVKEDLRNCNLKTPIWKYLGISLNSLVGRSSAEKDGHFIYYRYADILMMGAEAANELNMNEAANSKLAEIKERSLLSFNPIADQAGLRKEILDERAREFIIEGKRWFDLLRAAKRNEFAKKDIIINMILGNADIQRQAVLKAKLFNPMSYYLPIPEREMLSNPALVQNPSYNQ